MMKWFIHCLPVAFVLYVLHSGYKMVSYESGTAYFTRAGEAVASGDAKYGTFLSYPIRYSYVVNGIVYHSESPIAGRADRFETGDEISIKYDRENPEIHILLNFYGLYGNLFGYACAMVVIYIMLLRWLQWRRKKDMNSE